MARARLRDKLGMFYRDRPVDTLVRKLYVYEIWSILWFRLGQFSVASEGISAVVFAALGFVYLVFGRTMADPTTDISRTIVHGWPVLPILLIALGVAHATELLRHTTRQVVWRRKVFCAMEFVLWFYSSINVYNLGIIGPSFIVLIIALLLLYAVLRKDYN